MAIAATSDAGSERGAPREPVVPRLAATVALVRDATGGPEVYLMRRPPTMTFAPGVWVVPGGSVDPLDATTASPTTPATTDRSAWAPTGLCTMDAERVLAAAVREVFEETAVLLATDPADRVPALAAGRRVRLRTAVRAGTLRLADVLHEQRLRLDARVLVPWSRWHPPASECRGARPPRPRRAAADHPDPGAARSAGRRPQPGHAARRAALAAAGCRRDAAPAGRTRRDRAADARCRPTDRPTT